MSEWKVCKLKDIGCSFLSGFAFNSTDYRNEGIALIKIGNIQDRIVHIDKSDDFISDDIIDDKITKYFIKNKDVLIAMTGQGSVGRVGRIRLKNNERVLLNQRVGKFICDEKGVNLDYLFYVLASVKYQDALFNAGAGSGQPNLSPELILDFEIPAPEYKKQIQIANILSSLDDKIDLLHRQNKTLEQLAETLFRQWFVEEAEDSWESVRICDVAKINFKTVSKNFPFSEIEYLDTGSITDGIISEFQTFNLVDAPSRAQRIVEDNDIVYSLVRPIQRHYGLLSGLNPNTVVSTGFCVITCTDFSPYFLYILLSRTENIEYLDMIAEGATSTYPSLKPSNIANFEFPKPPQERLNRFSKIASDTWDKIKSNTNQIRTLTQLRDTLLPKLMSGEVRVKM